MTIRIISLYRAAPDERCYGLLAARLPIGRDENDDPVRGTPSARSIPGGEAEHPANVCPLHAEIKSTIGLYPRAS
jgi:hypothetical protein